MLGKGLRKKKFVLKDEIYDKSSCTCLNYICKHIVDKGQEWHPNAFKRKQKKKANLLTITYKHI
ncbi:hypothetical protein BpHYR1_036563 [Brachionus plicatilis]|uniref:Uncharacterized protein n=1 Tax=Brachionus plicatilis TaxID=10195 RepID=A0A3M7PXK8_BRAPC|nr:hypothetical protein BpHYR1_036563 [Brachionus plicatilis]